MADAGTVDDLVGRLLRELVPDKYANVDFSPFLSKAENLMAQEKIWAFLAWRGDTPVGVLTLHEGHALYANGAFGEISELWIAPVHRSSGAGQLLINAAKTFAREKGWSSLEVGAPDQPRWARSAAFYKSMGFEEVGPRFDLPLMDD